MANDEIINLMAIADLEDAEMLANQPDRVFHIRDDPFRMSDSLFVREYRLTKMMVQELINLLEPLLINAARKSALDVKVKVFITLHFLAYGSYQLSIGRNVTIAVSQSSVSRAITEVVDAMNTPDVFNHFVKFPQTLQELRSIQAKFFNIYGFPGIIGAIDCTHIAIIAPKANEDEYPEAAYVNRKGFHSINVQLICDTDMKILNVCARYPGSTNDTYIWNNSEVQILLRNLHRAGHRSFRLLGDSGYPLRPWLQIPYAEPQSESEEQFNNSQKTARNTIERCNGLLKSRFRCLLKHRVLNYHPEHCSRIINACVILHNFCTINNIPPPEDYDIQENNHEFEDIEPIPVANIRQNRVNPELEAGRAVRRQITQNYFA